MKLVCWNFEYLRTAQLCFNNLLDCFDFFAISGHCLFKEQLGLLEARTDHKYKYIAISASENKPMEVLHYFGSRPLTISSPL